ncbi:hypothetical protein HYC85_009371 [Camellia sinensis]|uniref:Uncharacterized protein n=1 Tax=Camellia sinensis TaxID=4442 RepID=A0A7J7HG13_CAMSI|nr:hypothetical protein HYC85_009371 [Camellia sinensis]
MEPKEMPQMYHSYHICPPKSITRKDIPNTSIINFSLTRHKGQNGVDPLIM